MPCTRWRRAHRSSIRATACTDPGNGGLYELIDNHLADIVTNSYGYNGEVDAGLSTDFINAENQFFLQAAAEGMSIVFSSGDDSDLAAINGVASGSWEATSPYVTAVGGTSLALLDRNGDKKEWGWGTYRVSMNGVTVAANGKTIATSGPALPFAYYAGAGGGPSLVRSWRRRIRRRYRTACPAIPHWPTARSFR